VIRVVLDTNIVISALISPFGNEAFVLHAVQIGRVVPCMTRDIADEYSNVLARAKFGFSPGQIDGVMELMRSHGLIVEPARRMKASPDPKDDQFIACAIAADAHFLVTGNRRHFPSQSCGNTRVVSSKELIEFLSKPQSP
jgi:uncharacterized protein